jgi:ADP-heptose:LPS heptosyltransferase
MNLLELINIREKTIGYPLKKLTSSPLLISFLKNNKLKNGGFLLFNVGGGWESKILPVENYIGMVNRLTTNHPVVILWGNEKEKRIAALVSGKTDAIMAIPTDFNDLILLIQKAGILISGDTLPLHIADMVGTPSIGLFGPTNPSRNGSLLPGSQSLYKKMSCGFCYKKKCDTMECLKSITSAEVAEAVININEKHN